MRRVAQAKAAAEAAAKKAEEELIKKEKDCRRSPRLVGLVFIWRLRVACTRASLARWLCTAT